jgi:transcriptional regulator with XRE-family HTH domain
MEQKLGDRIRKYRQLRDIKQSYISRMLGISVSAYGKIERGETHLTIARLTEISEFLGFSVQEILQPEQPHQRHHRSGFHEGIAGSNGEQEDLRKILHTLPVLLENQHTLMQKLLHVVESKL